MKVPLYRLAHARSGDKGDGSNVGLLAYDRASWELLRRVLTPARVRRHFRRIALGRVERFELPNLLGFNFILHDSLGGGGSASLKNDAQGKTHGMALLRLEIDLPRGFRLPEVGRKGALAPGGELGVGKPRTAARPAAPRKAAARATRRRS